MDFKNHPMIKCHTTFAIAFCLFIVCGCIDSNQDNLLSPSDLKVKWELVTNLYQGKNQALAAFTIYNNGKIPLKNSGWEMFFSQMPPIPIIEDSLRAGKVIHLNGDWFKLVPQTNFLLKPGDSIKIGYCGTGFMIKKTDAAMGIYFVFYDSNGKEKRIVPVGIESIGNFDRPEQLKRTEIDLTEVPTPESRYRDNQSYTKLPENEQQILVPSPVSLKCKQDTFYLNCQWPIYYQEGLEMEAGYLSRKLKSITGKDFILTKGVPPSFPAISLQKKSGQKRPNESYILRINKERGIIIEGADAAGVFYGIQSFFATLPPESFGRQTIQHKLFTLQIEDTPRFPYRGLQFDMARNFQRKETILKMLDLMAFYKLNHFLFYFMEDEGWRVEIPGLPELTEIGSKRLHGKLGDPILHPSYGSGPFSDGKENHGCGYYTAEDFIEILLFAKERHITVVPVINFPAHVRSAIKSMEWRYEKFMKIGKITEANKFRLIDPDDTSRYISAQGYRDNVVCIGRESIYHFYETAVKGIKQLYERAGLPMEKFHTGGDEVAIGCWRGSPMVKMLLSEHPEISPDEKSLQAYCFKRISAILKNNGVTSIGGWEEAVLLSDAGGKPILNAEFIDKGVLPYVWNNMEGSEDLGYKLANAGYKIVLCDVSNLYMDFPYNKDPEEPGNYWAGFLDTKDFYAFAPYDLFTTITKTAMGRKIDTKSEFKDKVRLQQKSYKNILGVQAQIWSETIKGEEMLEYYYLPRLIAFSETAWSPARLWEKTDNQLLRQNQIKQGWNSLANALAIKELPRLSFLNGGYNFRIPPPGAIIKDGILNANVEFPGLEIRYTTDGSEPNQSSTVFTKPVKVSGIVHLKSFVPEGRSSKTCTVNVN